MRAKGFVLKRKGSKLLIELKPKAITKSNEKGEKRVVFMWKLTKKVPKEGSVVRIIWHDKDNEDLGWVL